MRRRDGVAHGDVAVPTVQVQARLLRGRDGRLSRSRLEELESAGLDPLSPELLVSLTWLVLDSVRIAEGELKAARRRAMLVLASGGDPHRDLDLDSVAVERLAAELDAPERRAALAEGLAALEAADLPNVASARTTLVSEPDLAWRIFALALLADELAEM
jgi:hypothetical protein